MELLSISDLADKSYMELSGGQQQRVLLARALCAAHRLLILDEPTTNLDPVATAAFYDVVKILNRDRNITIIMVSHDVSAAVRNANRILHIETEPVFFGSIEDYINTDIGRRMLGAN
jgi:zinc transport system ATP-binding protein